MEVHYVYKLFWVASMALNGGCTVREEQASLLLIRLLGNDERFWEDAEGG